MRLVAALSEQPKVSDWPTRLLLVALTFAIIAFLFFLIARSWRRRARRQEGLGELPTIPAQVLADIAAGNLDSVEVRYIGTAAATDWDDKIAYRGLANRGFADVTVHELGILIDRVATQPLFIPRDAIMQVALVQGVAGRVYGKDGVVAIRWVHTDFVLDTGLRSSARDIRRELVASIQNMAADGKHFHRGEDLQTQVEPATAGSQELED